MHDVAAHLLYVIRHMTHVPEIRSHKSTRDNSTRLRFNCNNVHTNCNFDQKTVFHFFQDSILTHLSNQQTTRKHKSKTERTDSVWLMVTSSTLVLK